MFLIFFFVCRQFPRNQAGPQTKFTFKLMFSVSRNFIIIIIVIITIYSNHIYFNICFSCVRRLYIFLRFFAEFYLFQSPLLNNSLNNFHNHLLAKLSPTSEFLSRWLNNCILQFCNYCAMGFLQPKNAHSPNHSCIFFHPVLIASLSLTAQDALPKSKTIAKDNIRFR